MLPRRLLFLLLIIRCLNAHSQMLFSTGETFAIGNITSVANNTWNINGNAAHLATLTGSQIQVGQTLPYGIPQLSTTQINGAISINENSGIGVQFARNGHHLIAHTRLDLNYGLQLTSGLSGGIKVIYHRWNQGESYPTFQTFAPEIGLVAKVNSTIQIGSQIQLNVSEKNPFKNEVDMFKIGTLYELDKKTCFLAEVTHTNNSQQLVIGARYLINHWATVVVSTGIKPGLFSFGFTITKNKTLFINAATQWQPELGFTPSIGLLFVTQ